jgi:hypothetical protein
MVPGLCRQHPAAAHEANGIRADLRAASREAPFAPAASNDTAAPLTSPRYQNGINGINVAATIPNNNNTNAPASRLSDNMARQNGDEREGQGGTLAIASDTLRTRAFTDLEPDMEQHGCSQ